MPSTDPMPYCRKCSSRIPDDSIYCPYCAVPTVALNAPQPESATGTAPVEMSGRTKRLLTCLAVAAISAITLSGALLTTDSAGDPPRPSVTATAQAVILNPTQPVIPTPTAAPSSTFVPTTLLVSADGDGVWLRRTPAMSDKVKAWQDGTVMVALAPVQTVDGREWRNVRDPDGNVGWIPSQYLVAPTCPAVPTLP
jgi:hypothetical protein